MILTDKTALKELKRANSFELENSVNCYPENERDGRSDLQMLADECSYIVSNFEECGHVLYEDLEHAREVLRETRNGKFIPLYSNLTPKYRNSDIEIARGSINEYRRLKNCLKRLNKMGYYGRWY